MKPFYQKIYKPLKKDLFDINHVFGFLAILNALSHSVFFYKSNLVRTKALILAKKNQEQAKNKAEPAIPQNIRTKWLGQPFLKK